MNMSKTNYDIVKRLRTISEICINWYRSLFLSKTMSLFDCFLVPFCIINISHTITDVLYVERYIRCCPIYNLFGYLDNNV